MKVVGWVGRLEGWKVAVLTEAISEHIRSSSKLDRSGHERDSDRLPKQKTRF